MTSWLVHYGVVAVFCLMLVDAVFPAASELVMLYGGALASGALAHRAGVVGYQVGAIAGWWVGDRGGRPFLERRGRWFHLTPTQIDRADRWFDRWDTRAVFLGRITPVARSFISIPAGVFAMPFRPYNVWTFLGNSIWCLVLAGVGWGLGTGYTKFHHDFTYVEVAVVVLIVLFVAYLAVRRWLSSTMRAGHADSAR